MVIVGHIYGAAAAVDYADIATNTIRQMGGVPNIHLITIDGIDRDSKGLQSNH